LKTWPHLDEACAGVKTRTRNAGLALLYGMDERALETSDPREEIARLEERIEELEMRLDSCRKFAAAARLAIALGGLLLLGLISGVIPFDPLTLTGAMAAGLGGVVMLGSNNGTAKEATAQLAEAAGQRAALIGALELRPVESPARLH
jgi:hypothetical protein